VTTYTPPKTQAYEDKVKLAAHAAMAGKQVFVDAVACVVELYAPIPQSWSKRRTQEALNGEMLPISKPDIDNVIKGIFDACNGIVWDDDSQVVELHIAKRYSANPRVAIEVTSAGAVSQYMPNRL